MPKKHKVYLIFKDRTRFCWAFDEVYQAKNWANEVMVVFPGGWQVSGERRSTLGGWISRFTCTNEESPLTKIEIIERGK